MILRMPGRLQSLAEADWLTRRQLLDAGRELRIARIAAGYRLRDVARRVGISASQISRIERGRHAAVTYAQVAALAAAVGLKLLVNFVPARRRILDQPQVRLFATLRQRANPAWAWSTEVPIPIAGDLRAADAVGRIPGCAIVVELINRFSNFQLQARAALLKGRDLHADRVLLVVRATATNREALREAGPALASSFPLGTRHVLRTLAEGRDPGGNGIVLL
jgi:transcriptional regulator with XRE-family HTH domain